MARSDAGLDDKPWKRVPSGSVKLSVRCEYALRALMALAEAPDGALLRIQAIAERQRIPKRFLEQILNDLRSGGFVESRRGVTGGYRLARPAHAISVREVVEYLEVPGATNTGRNTSPGNREASDEVLHEVWAQAQSALLHALQQWSIAALCDRARELRRQRGELMDFVI